MDRAEAPKTSPPPSLSSQSGDTNAISSSADSLPVRRATVHFDQTTLVDDTTHTPNPSGSPPVSNAYDHGPGHSSTAQPLGQARRKKHLNWLDIASVAIAIICFVVSFITVSPNGPLNGSIPWRLGLKRQLQITGLMLSIMNQCLRVIAPKAFLLTEARFGKSYLQNYDAILRNSVFQSHTGLIWRAVLLALIALPTGLSVAYKEFIQGTGTRVLHNSGGYYGLTGPGIISDVPDAVGLSLLVNATLPFIIASSDDSTPLPAQPQAYGFNTLLLSDSRTAYLDGPTPDYVSTIQGNLSESETRRIDATVTAIVVAYNDTAEYHRKDDEFWDYYWNQPGINGMNPIDLYNGNSIGLLVNNLGHQNSSWCFFAWLNTGARDAHPPYRSAFQTNATGFNIRRDSCQGSWLVSWNSIQLIGGDCHSPPLDSDQQKMLTNTSLGFTNFYYPSLIEFLGPLANTRNESHWRLPMVTTVVAGMYWSRLTARFGHSTWPPGITVESAPQIDYGPKRSDVYYYVHDYTTSTKPTMNSSSILYFVFAVQPFLALVALIAAWAYYRTPLDSGFGMVAILAGVRHESLRLLWGASMSGDLSKPVRMKIAVDDPVTTIGKAAPPQVEYILGREGKNESLSHALRYRDAYFANKLYNVQRRLGRSGTQYEMLSR